jgi:predicted RNase H-like HicB family nuclease
MDTAEPGRTTFSNDAGWTVQKALKINESSGLTKASKRVSIMATKFRESVQTKSMGGRILKSCQGTAPARSKDLSFPIVIEADADGYFVSCPSLQGCYSQGNTYEEAVENIKDAIRLHIEDRLADGEEIPQNPSISLSTVEITI